MKSTILIGLALLSIGFLYWFLCNQRVTGLHSVSVVAKQAPLALSNAKVSCKHGLWLVARVNKKRISSDILFHRIYYLFFSLFYHTGMFPRRFIIVDAYQPCLYTHCVFVLIYKNVVPVFEVLLGSEQLQNDIHRISCLCCMPFPCHLNGTVHIPGCCHYKNRQTVPVTAVDLTLPVFQAFILFLNAFQQFRRNPPSLRFFCHHSNCR